MELKHKHLLVRAEVLDPPKDLKMMRKWTKNLIKDIDLSAWRTNFKANLDAVFLSLNILMPKMMEAGKGSIVNIASVVGLRGTAYMAGYAAAKAGLINLTKSAACLLYTSPSPRD